MEGFFSLAHTTNAALVEKFSPLGEIPPIPGENVFTFVKHFQHLQEGFNSGV